MQSTTKLYGPAPYLSPAYTLIQLILYSFTTGLEKAPEQPNIIIIKRSIKSFKKHYKGAITVTKLDNNL